MAGKVKFQATTELTVKGIVGFMKREVTWYGTGAKVTCPKEFLGRTAYLVITNEEWHEDGAKSRKVRR